MSVCRRIAVLCAVAAMALLCLQTAAVAETSSVTLNFNGAGIPGDGRIVWFNSVLAPSYSGSLPFTIYVENSSLVLTKAGAQTFTLALPNSQITYSSTITTPTITYDAGSNTWIEQIPWGLPGNTFQNGLAFMVPTGQDLGGYTAVWSGDYSGSTHGIPITWQAGAAVYTFPVTDLNTLNVKPVDPIVTMVPSWYSTKPAGTPMFLASPGLLAAGGTGDGTSFTGLYTSASVVATPEPSCVASAILVLTSGGFALVPFARRRRSQQ